MGDEHVGADDAVPADDGAAAQDRRAGVDGHVVLDGGVPLFAPEALPAPGAQRAQGHALIDLHMVADDGGFAHHDAGAVVNEEVFSNGGAGVDVNAGDAVGVLGHDPGQQRHPQGVEHMGQPVDGDGKQAGIAENDLVHAEGGGVAVEKRLHIGLGHGPDGGDLLEEGDAQLLGLFGGGLLAQFAFEYQRQLLIQIVHHVLNEHGQIVAHIVDAVILIPGGAGVDDAHELADHVDDHFLVRVTEVVHFVNGPPMAVVLQNAVHKSLNLFFNGGHRPIPPYQLCSV